MKSALLIVLAVTAVSLTVAGSSAAGLLPSSVIFRELSTRASDL